MIHRSVIRLSSAALLAGLVLGCGDKDFPTEPDDFLTVTPLFTDIGETEQVQLVATAGIGGPVVPVTWESSNTASATVTAGGLVTGVSVCAGATPPCAARIVPITATLVADPTQRRTSDVSVVVRQGTLLVKGAGVTLASSGARGSGQLYRIFVPPGTTSLVFTLAGGSGDADIYVRRATPPTNASFTHFSFEIGNDENITISNPQSGVWYVLVDLWDPYANTVLTANYTP